MPTYLARCPECEHEEEYWAKISESDSLPPLCVDCGEQMEKVPIGNDGGFILKGEGWYSGGGHV